MSAISKVHSVVWSKIINKARITLIMLHDAVSPSVA